MHGLVTVSSSLTVAAAESDGVVSTATDDAGVARQLCDGREPVVDMTTGRAYSDCNHCPPSSYCHRLSSAQSACCWIGIQQP